MNTPTAPNFDVTPKDIILGKLARFAQLDFSISTTTAKQQEQVTAIVSATKRTLAPLEEERAKLEEEIKALAAENKGSLCGKKKSVNLGTHTIAFRDSSVVECENDEALVELLEAFATDPANSEAYQLAAKACLRYKEPTLDKEFVKKHWGTHGEWFTTHFGIQVVKGETVNITANKAPKTDA